MEISGIVHVHSHYSYDAKLSLSELRELCIRAGLQFACMTEHTDELSALEASAFVAECESLSDDVFRFVPGFEVPYHHAHILMIGMRNFYDVYAPTIEILKKWTEESSFVVLAHPVRNHFNVDDGLLNEIDALEVWNQQYEGKRVPRTRSMKLLKELRTQKPVLLAMGGVDLHRGEHMGSPVVTFAVDTLSEVSILEKLKLGAYKVSSPQADFYGTLPDVSEKIKEYRFESFISVSIITVGKFVNKVLATVGISLPKSLKQVIRKGI